MGEEALETLFLSFHPRQNGTQTLTSYQSMHETALACSYLNVNEKHGDSK